MDGIWFFVTAVDAYIAVILTSKTEVAVAVATHGDAAVIDKW